MAVSVREKGEKNGDDASTPKQHGPGGKGRAKKRSEPQGEGGGRWGEKGFEKALNLYRKAPILKSMPIVGFQKRFGGFRIKPWKRKHSVPMIPVGDMPFPS